MNYKTTAMRSRHRIAVLTPKANAHSSEKEIKITREKGPRALSDRENMAMISSIENACGKFSCPTSIEPPLSCFLVLTPEEQKERVYKAVEYIINGGKS